MEAKPWHRFYDPGVPPSLQPYPERTLVDFCAETARQRPEHTALIFKGKKITYGELENLSNAFAAALAGLGVNKGDRVALFLPNTPQTVICMLGAWKAGAVAVPSNPLYTEREIEHALRECGAETAVVMTAFYGKVKAVQANTRVRNVIATNIKEYLPPVLKLLFTLVKEKKEGHHITLQSGDHWLQELLAKAGAPPKVQVKAADDAVMLFSGGTTGTPKAAIGTHHALVMSGMQICAWFKGTLLEWDDVILANMPFFHVYGMAGVLTVGIVNRDPLALVPNPRDLEDLLATIEKTRPAFLPGVPTLFNSLLKLPRVQEGKADLTCLKLSISGAAPLLLDIKQRYEKATGGRIVEGFAMTETMMGAIITPAKGVYKEGAVGLPVSDIEVRIVDPETGTQELPAGQVGEMTVRAPNLMRGYWMQPTETANTIRDGWLFTGDLGYLDEDGYLFIVDRKKDVIKPSGFQVWPREVEEVLASHPAVGEVGVAGVPDPHQVEAVKAWVVLRPGEQVTAEALQEYCRQKLAAYKVPRQIEFLQALPKSTVGKVLRRELAAKDRQK